jgi:hypothetical protein
MIISAPRFNTASVRPLGVELLNLGCPVLDALQGRGIWFDYLRTNGDDQLSMKERKSKTPPVIRRDRWGTRSSKSLKARATRPVDEYLDKGLFLQFENGSSISLSLRVGRDFPCLEVAEFHGLKTNFMIIWQVGEEPFD